MATELQVVNSALTKIGAPLITQAQLDDGSTKEARLTKERLPHTRLNLLRLHPWNEAITRVKFSVANTNTQMVQPLNALLNGSSNVGFLSTSYLYLKSGTTDTWEYWNTVSGASYQSIYNGQALQFKYGTIPSGNGSGSTGWYVWHNAVTEYIVSTNSYFPPEGKWLIGATGVAKTVETVKHHADLVTTSTDSLTYPNSNTYSDGTAGTLTTPAFNFSYSLTLPTNCLRVLDVYDSDKDYRIEGGKLFSNIQTPEILYVSDLALTSFSPTLVEALAYSLAYDISYSITQSQGVWEMAERGYQICLARAKTIDAQEDGRYHVEAELFDDSRYGTSIFADYRNHHRP